MPTGRLTRRRLLGAATLPLLADVITSAAAPARIRIGTGNLLGIYFPIGGAICRLVAARRGGDGRQCTEIATAGSVQNLQALRRGGMEFGIAQSDVVYQAVSGAGPFVWDGPDRALRSVLRVVPEPFTVITAGVFGPSVFGDLRGRRVSIGEPGSGQLATVASVLAAAGWSERDLVLVADRSADQQSFALCDGLIDAFVLVAATPSPVIREAATRCDARVVPLEEELIEAMVRDRPFYRRVTIPGGVYPGNPTPVATFATDALLVASTTTPVELVHEVVEAVLADLPGFRRLHLAFAGVTAESLVPDGRLLPLHDGAERYFRRSGLV